MKIGVLACVLAVSVFLVGCAKPPAPDDANSAGIAVYVKGRAPIKVLPAQVDRVFFALLSEDGDTLLASRIYLSNYARGGYYYLLNAPPGRYVAIGTTAVVKDARPQESVGDTAFYDVKAGRWKKAAPTPGARAWDEPAQNFGVATYFEEGLVQSTQTEVQSGALSFMGEFTVQLSILRAADPVQSHYFRMLQPGESRNWFAQGLFNSQGIYSGSHAGSERGETARTRFLRAVAAHLGEAGWANIPIGHYGEPAP